MKHLRFFNVFLIAFLATIVTVSGDGLAQINSVSVGWDGQCKLGYWVPVRVEVDQSVSKNIILEVTVPDTDGIPTTFIDKAPVRGEIDGKSYLNSIVKIGRTKGMVSVRLLESENELVAKDFRLESVCNSIDALVECYVSVGNPVDLSSAAAIGSNSTYAKPVSVVLPNPQVLPASWKAYESIDGMILEISQLVDNPLSPRVQQAILTWVEQGGRIAFTGGEKLEAFFVENPVLAKLFSGRVVDSRSLASTSSIERILKADVQVETQNGRQKVAILADYLGDPIVKEGSDVVVLRERVGFGQVILVTINLAEEPISKWQSRNRLTGYVISLLNFKPATRHEQTSRTSRFGYQDISGQLRMALDSFQSVSVINFTVVAAIAILFIALIGPGDFFFLKKLIKRMEWTWVSFLSIVVLISALIFLIHSYSKSDQLLCRQVEIVDIDLEQNTVRGSLWAHVYSPSSEKYDIQWDTTADIEPTQKYCSWFGFPGTALGGMDNNAPTAGGAASYSIELNSNGISQIPVNVSATKGIQMDWTGKPAKPIEMSLEMESNSLTGRVHNPLSVELENVFVVHERNVFEYKAKLKAGDSFDVGEDATERSLADYLNQRKVKDLGTEATPWSNTDSNLKRILEIMMFYEKAGGQGYVNLFQRYQANIDLSNAVGPKKAILVGRTKQPANRMRINELKNENIYEESWTYYRIVIPVKTNSRN